MGINPLDKYHSLVKVYYQSLYVKAESWVVYVDFSIIYLVRVIDDEPRIVGYIICDEQTLLKENGLI